MPKQPEFTLDEVFKHYSREQIKAKMVADEQAELQPRKDKVLAQFTTLKAEVDAIRKIDKTFAFPWRTATKQTSSGKVLQDADLLTIQNLVKDEAKQLKYVADTLGVHALSLKKFLKGKPGFKVTTKDKKAIVSYSAPAK